MGGTFEHFFKTRFPPELKKVNSVEELVRNFRNWNANGIVTMRQRIALEEQAKELGIKSYDY
jgi:ribosomal protein L32E